MRYVVLGASAAGINGAATLRSLDQEAEIFLISEDDAVYSRCMMHHFMEGIRSMDRLSFVEKEFFVKNRIKWIKGKRAIALNAAASELELSDRETIMYDKLLIATGSHSFIPPIAGIHKAANVFGFHDINDCRQIMNQARQAEHIIILGAGLVGIDAASGLLSMGKKITIVDVKEHMLSMQLDQRAAGVYEEAFAARGVRQYYNVGIEQVIMEEKHSTEEMQSVKESRITSVLLSNGCSLPCDLLIVAAGVRANVEFLKGSSVKTDKFGLLIDDRGQTNIENIYGAGDVTGRNPIWPAAVKEGIIAASNMAAVQRRMTDFFASKSTMNFLSIPTMSLGLNEPEDDTYLVDRMEDQNGNYKKIIHKNGTIYGAILQGDLSYAGVLTQLIRRRIDITKVKKSIFSIDYSDFFCMDDNLEFSYTEEEEF